MTSTQKSSHYVFKGLALETFGPLDFRQKRPRDSLIRLVLYLLKNQYTSKQKSVYMKESLLLYKEEILGSGLMLYVDSNL